MATKLKNVKEEIRADLGLIYVKRIPLAEIHIEMKKIINFVKIIKLFPHLKCLSFISADSKALIVAMTSVIKFTMIPFQSQNFHQRYELVRDWD